MHVCIKTVIDLSISKDDDDGGSQLVMPVRVVWPKVFHCLRKLIACMWVLMSLERGPFSSSSNRRRRSRDLWLSLLWFLTLIFNPSLHHVSDDVMMLAAELVTFLTTAEKGSFFFSCCRSPSSVSLSLCFMKRSLGMTFWTSNHSASVLILFLFLTSEVYTTYGDGQIANQILHADVEPVL